MNGNKVTFEEHRRKHYDEFRKAKMLSLQDSKSEEDEVQDEEDKKMKLATICKPAENQALCTLDNGIVALSLQERSQRDLRF